MPDVFKILKDLEYRSVGINPETNKMQEGYFASFRTVGLPIHKEDFENPWSPTGIDYDKPIPNSPVIDPKDAPKTGSGAMDELTVAREAAGAAQRSYLNAFLLTDNKLQMDKEYQVVPASSKLSDAWYAITTGANGIPVKTVVGGALQQAYDQARAMTSAENEKYKAYLKYRGEHRNAVRSWEREYTSVLSDPAKLTAWPITGRSFREDADAAMDAWVGQGYKYEIEEALDTLAAQGTDPAIALISRSKKRFTNSLLEFQGIGMIPYTLMSPSTWYDRDKDDGWYEYTSRDFHTESHYDSSSTSYGGGGGFSFGFWGSGGGFHSSSHRDDLNMQTNNLEISFKYSIVDIQRPWLDTSLLNLKNWFLKGDYKKGCISNGKMDQHLPANAIEPTFLPSIVTSMILLKDLNIKWDNWKSQWSNRSNSENSGYSFGWGPFAVDGHYSHHNERRDFVADETGESLRVRGIQIAGYISAITPESPAVDSAPYLDPTSGT